MRTGIRDLDLYVKVGKAVAEARKKARMTQTDLAEVAQMTRGSIANIEVGRQFVPLDTLYGLAECLGVSILVLIPRPHVSRWS